MQTFQCGYSNRQSTDKLIEECLSRAGTIPGDANFGFIYATDSLANELDTIIAALKQTTTIRHWTGTVGLGISVTGQEFYEEPALVILIASFPEHAFRIVPLQRTDVDSFIHANRDWLKQDEMYFGIIHGDPENPATPDLITQLATRIPGAFFAGGLTSSRQQNPQIAGDICDGGISGVMFTSDIPVATAHTQGCTPISSQHVITDCEQNIIIELDDRPALDVFNEDVGEVIARDPQRAAGHIFVGLPIPGTDTGDYVVRNLVGIDPSSKLVAISDIPDKGSEIMFCRRDGNTALNDMQRMLADIRQRLPGTPKGALYYSCTARGRYQFGENSEELKLIHDELGDIPLVGFFANGEIFHNRLYGYTGVLTVFC